MLDVHKDVNYKMALVDHISSPAAIVQPMKEIVRICHERKVKVLVD